MKNILILIVFFLVSSCETVIDVDLNTAPERLVVDANINWEKGTTGNTQTIILSKSAGYYQNGTPKVSGAVVYITDSSNNVFDFTEEPYVDSITGRYTCSFFQPVLGETYTLTIVVEGKTYTAVESLLPTPDISNIEQENNLGINNDEIGIKINFNDEPIQSNYYLLRTDDTTQLFPYYQVFNDQFNQGNIISGLYSSPDLVSGNQINFKLYGISKRYHNYMKLLINASAGSDNGPFQVIPTIVRGNIINQTNSQEFAFGYFRLGETNSSIYIVQ